MSRKIINLFMCDDLKAALSRVLASAYDISETPSTPKDVVIIEACYPEPDNLYCGIKYAYTIWADELKQWGNKEDLTPIILMSHDHNSKILELLKRCGVYQGDQGGGAGNSGLPDEKALLVVKWEGLEIPELIKIIEKSSGQRAKKEEFDKLATILRRYHESRQPHALPWTKEKKGSRFIPNLPWNILVIDNDLESTEKKEPSGGIALCNVLSWPKNAFWCNSIFKIRPYWPEDLFKKEQDLLNFNEQVKKRISDYNIDIILLDVALSGMGRDHYAFYLVDEIKKAIFESGRQNIPIIMFSKLLDLEFIISSINRGAQWYASKFEATHYSWVGDLKGILDTLSSQWLWRYEYEKKILEGCIGEDFKKACKNHKRYIAENEWDLSDEFFDNDNNANTLEEIKFACKKKKKEDKDEGSLIDIDKFSEYHYIFRRLFNSYDNIRMIKKAEGGLSGTDLFYVVPNKKGLDYSAQIVKIGQYAEIERERENFEEWINGMLDSFIGRIKAGPIRAQKYAGLLYVAVGIKEDYEKGNAPISLKKLIESMVEDKAINGNHIEFQEVKSLIENIFTKVLSCFYERKTQKKGEPKQIISTYIEDLPSTLVGELVGVKICPDDEIRFDENDWYLAQGYKWTDKEKKSIEGLNKIQGVEKGDLCIFENFALYEIDREEKKLKIINKKVSSREIGEEDLRVDISIGEGNFIELFEDPRIEVGKKLTLAVQIKEKIWESERLKFIKGRDMHPCRKAMKNLEGLLIGNLRHEEGKSPPTREYGLYEIYQDLIDKRGLCKKKDLMISNIHGDLNLDNILITFSAGKPLGWFIDFRRSRKGHIAFDYAKLETEIKTHVLSKYLGNIINKMQFQGKARDEAFEDWLRWYYKFEMEFAIPDSPILSMEKNEFYRESWTPIVYICELILLIRKLAAKYDIAEDYNWSLFLYSFSALKFKVLDGDESPDYDSKSSIGPPPLPKCLAYISACCACTKLIKNGEIYGGAKP